MTETRIKVDLHTHTSDDPEDAIGHSGPDLIDRAVALQYGALAITLHNRYSDCRALDVYARDRGLVLIPAVERSIDGAHTLLINFPPESAEVDSFEALRLFKARHPQGLVVAPHPWFPLGNSLGASRMERYADLWDAVEINAFYTRLVDFNRAARRWAANRSCPLVGNGDIHQLRQFGSTYSLVAVQGAVNPDSICSAIKAGRVDVCSRPISHRRAASIAVRGIFAGLTGRPW
ncbi:MAG: PHP domain-containing protein [Vicinamibacterales bacterium]